MIDHMICVCIYIIICIHTVYNTSSGNLMELMHEASPKCQTAFIGSGAVLCCPTAAAFFDGLKEGLGSAPKSQRDTKGLWESVWLREIAILWYFFVTDFFLYLIVSDRSCYVILFNPKVSIREHLLYNAPHRFVNKAGMSTRPCWTLRTCSQHF